MSDDNADPDSTTIEILTYTVEQDYPINVPTIEDNVQPKKPKKRKMSTKTGKAQHDSYPSTKTFVYCKTYYRQRVRSLLQFVNETNKLEARVLSSAGCNLPANEQPESSSHYFTVLGRRFQNLTNLQ